ncbi:MAG: transposase [Bacteroides sp.]|nr:transposase [Bacteroides sp.]
MPKTTAPVRSMIPIKENLGNRVSTDKISSITDRVLPEIQTWCSRPLEMSMPLFGWMQFTTK